MKLNGAWDRIISLLYPPRCVLCGRVVEYGCIWCGGCDFAPEELVVRGEQGIKALSPIIYQGNVRRAVWSIKRRKDRAVAAFFSEYMARTVKRHCDVRFDLATPVPINPRRLRERGFNQAELLAGEIAQHLECTVATGILERSDHSEIQHRLSAQKRRENAKHSYALAPGGQKLARGKRVLLVDDVYTTGATVEACTELLQTAGARQVVAVTAAYSPLDQMRRTSRQPEDGAVSCSVLCAPESDLGIPSDRDMEQLQKKVEKQLESLIRQEGVRSVLVGLDPGPGIFAAEAVLRWMEDCPGLELECCIPCEDYTERWTAHQRSVYAARCEAALQSGKAVVRYTPHGAFRRSSYRERDAYLLENCDRVLGVWDANAAGKQLAAAVQSRGRPLTLIHPGHLSNDD